jgi:4-hydroxybenzoate polyprenyltransferase
MVDKADDEIIGIKSTAILFGNHVQAAIAIIQMLVLIGLLGVGIKLKLTVSYYIAWLVAAGLIIYQQYLIRQADPSAWFKAFLNNQWFGLFIFIGIWLSYS